MGVWSHCVKFSLGLDLWCRLLSQRWEGLGRGIGPATGLLLRGRGLCACGFRPGAVSEPWVISGLALAPVRGGKIQKQILSVPCLPPRPARRDYFPRLWC